jgi:hypothetical protein
VPSSRSFVIAAALSLCCLLEAARGGVRAQPVGRADRAASSGLGVGVGVGTENVLLGGHVIYYLQLSQPRLRVALHAGAGFLPEFDAGPRHWGMTGGAFLAFGKRNRLVVGLIGGTLAWETYYLYGQELASRQVLGLGVCAGWELVTRRGFYVRGDVGPALMVERETPLEERNPGATVIISTSLGYKLW